MNLRVRSVTGVSAIFDNENLRTDSSKCEKDGKEDECESVDECGAFFFFWGVLLCE